MANEVLIRVEVCYIAPPQQFLKTLLLRDGSTIRDAIQSSNLLELQPELKLDEIKTGIYSKLKPLDTILKQQDRVEVYRPLHVDPMVARHARAQKRAKR